ncbi:MAG: hypothetical protein QM541_08875 [Flavobacterium sp.]|nr:hypothetical protein [Flavobacterium sp.]
MSSKSKDLVDLIKVQSSSQDDLDIDSDNLPIQVKKLEAIRYGSDTKDRKWLAIWTAITVSIWLLAVLSMLITNNKFLHLSDSVLISLLGTTTLNVLGLSFIVLRGHFKSTK